jgi:hypothetical protein
VSPNEAKGSCFKLGPLAVCAVMRTRQNAEYLTSPQHMWQVAETDTCKRLLCYNTSELNVGLTHVPLPLHQPHLGFLNISIIYTNTIESM